MQKHNTQKHNTQKHNTQKHNTQKHNTQKHNSYWDILPNEIQTIIVEHKAAKTIQRNAIKMFYRIYGITWEKDIENYERNFDIFCYLTGIYDPPYDYQNFFR
jgi:hypothetical protein